MSGRSIIPTMIDRAEIEAKSREFEIHVANVERDYVFGWVLFGIFSVSGLKDWIFLKGGNALRKGYFANTRFSADLDFGIENKLDFVAMSFVRAASDILELRKILAKATMGI